MNPLNRTVRFILLVGLTLLSGASYAQSEVADSKTSTAIAGQWRSVAPENYGGHFATRSFSFTDHEWQVVYRTYADEKAQQALFTIRVSGYYIVGDAAPKVTGAVEANFPARTRSLTAESDAGVAMFANMGCQLEKGREKALINAGCGFVPGVMQAMGEYDLVAIKEGRLFLGDRTADLTKARPERLTAFPLVRTP